MKRAAGLDWPTLADRTRLRLARSEAQRQVDAADEARRAAMLKAFWVEMRATIRSVSPFLQALLKSEGLSLNEVVAGIEPVPGWPRRPRLSAGGVAGPETRRHMFRYYLATLRTKNAQLHSIRDNAHGQTIIMANGAEARVQMIGHAIEVDLAIGETRLETRFGTLRDVLP